MTNQTITAAEAAACSYMNRAEINQSKHCGCFRCFAQFEPTAVTLWSDATDPNDDDPGALRSDDDQFKGNTAVCPYCEDTSVIGSASGAIISDEFLKAVHEYWFRK